jgi:hypothetical protein
MKLIIEIENLAASINVLNDKRSEQSLRLYAEYHGIVQKGMNRKKVLRAVLRQMLKEVESIAAAQFEEQRRAERRVEAIESTLMDVVETEEDEDSEITLPVEQKVSSKK